MADLSKTLGGRLKRMKWRFAEAGMHREWNELWAFATSVNTAQFGSGSAFSGLDFVTNCAPDVTPTGNFEDSGDATDDGNTHRRAEQGYQTKNIPRAGFIA